MSSYKVVGACEAATAAGRPMRLPSAGCPCGGLGNDGSDPGMANFKKIDLPSGYD